jgi:hypothetical protein
LDIRPELKFLMYQKLKMIFPNFISFLFSRKMVLKFFSRAILLMSIYGMGLNFLVRKKVIPKTYLKIIKIDGGSKNFRTTVNFHFLGYHSRISPFLDIRDFFRFLKRRPKDYIRTRDSCYMPFKANILKLSFKSM